jgi:hypothetical protein
MAQPIWITAAGSLGTIPEGVFFESPLQAYDPDNSPVYFSVISGQLPNGITISTNGSIEGVPSAIADIQGVPVNVNEDITSKFCIRAYTTRLLNGSTVVDRFQDRTFTLTVSGQNIPSFVTPAGSLGITQDAGYSEFQIEFTDNDTDDIVVVSVISGSLPTGMTIDNTGKIAGFIPPIDDSTELFEFAIGLTDGKSSNLREFSITVEKSAIIKPYIENFSPSNIGTYFSDSFFAFQFLGQDFEDQPIEYIEYTGSGLSFPPGTVLDSSTGWLYGNIPDLGITELTYNFAIQVQRVGDPSTLSDPYYFSVNVRGSVDSEISWLTDSNLGTINTGDTSILQVQAVSAAGLELFYRFKTNDYPTVNVGLYNKLPQGLTLLPSGHIAGRVSFNTFTLDSGETTFDVNPINRLIKQPTTFDLTYRFTVNAYSTNGVISVFRDFEILVNRAYNEPYENLYIKAMPTLEDRAVLRDMLTDQDIFVPSAIYRSDDPNFGVATDVVYFHAYGLTSSTVDQYLASLNENHYWKNLLLGPINTARALDSQGNVVYEVVYSPILDNLINNQGSSVSKSITLPYTVPFAYSPAPDPEVIETDITTVYPNSLINMRTQVIDEIGKISNYLPLWMTSKQENGQVLGYTPAWVICYTKPDQSQRIAYYLQNTYEDQLNKIDFKADRYELDRLLSRNWDPVADSTVGAWEPPGAATTFDLNNHYRITSLVDAGTGYAIDDIIVIAGNDIGGQTGINDLTIRVLDVDINGAILDTALSGQAPWMTTGDTYTNITGITDGSGIDAEFNLIVASGSPTIFDDNSLRFESPVDNYTNTDEYDKYLIFPKRNILV